MDQDATSVRERLRRIIERRAQDIERRWLERIQRDVVKEPGVELTLLRDGMPDYLRELTKALANGAEPLDYRAGSAWARVPSRPGDAGAAARRGRRRPSARPDQAQRTAPPIQAAGGASEPPQPAASGTVLRLAAPFGAHLVPTRQIAHAPSTRRGRIGK